MARGDILPVAAEEGRIVVGEGHRHGGLVDGDTGQCFGGIDIGNGIADFEALYAYQGAYLTRSSAFDAGAAHAFEDVQFLDALFHGGTVAFAQHDVLAFAQFTAVYAAYGDTAHIRREVERGDEHLRGAFDVFRGGNVFDDGIEQYRDVVGGFAPVGRHPVLFGRTVDGGEVELFLGGIEVEHQFEYHFLHLVGTAVLLVDLVDDDDGFQPHLNGLLQHKAGLGHGTFEGVDQQQAAVGHVEYAFHLATEVGVPRGVDDVYLAVFVPYRYVFRQNRYAAFPFEVVVVEHELARVLVVTEEAAGHQHLVDEGGFSVVDVGDDGDIPNVLFLHTLKNFPAQRYDKKCDN